MHTWMYATTTTQYPHLNASMFLLHVLQFWNETKFHFYAPAIKWQGAIKCLLCPSFHPSVLPSFCPSILLSFRPSVPSKFVFSAPPTSLYGFEWNLVGMLHHKCRSAFGEIIHVRQILTELWPLTLRIFTHFSLSSQLFIHPCIDLNETWQGCCTTSLEVHVGR